MGTPTSMCNEAGESVWERSLDSCGRLKYGDHSSCPFLFQGQYYDKEIELAYNRFRYYDPEDGRYISKDPIGLHSGENNFYAFVSDPNRELDVYGLSKSYGSKKKKTPHGNSKNSKKKNHVYEIYNKDTGKVYKVGISGGKKTKHDTPESYRANSQKRKIAEDAGTDVDNIGTRIVNDDLSRVDALDVEQAKVDSFYDNTGQQYSHNKRPKPSALK